MEKQRIPRAHSSAQAMLRIEPLKDGETAHFIFDVTVWNNSGRYMVRRDLGGVTLCHTPKRAAMMAVRLVNQARRENSLQRRG